MAKSVVLLTALSASTAAEMTLQIKPTLQVVSNPLLDREFQLKNGTRIPNPIHGTAWGMLRDLGADHVRFQPWFPYPHKSVAELQPPKDGKPTSWNFTDMMPQFEDFMANTAEQGHSVTWNVGTIPCWMYWGPTTGGCPYPADPDKSDFGYGARGIRYFARDPSGNQLAALKASYDLASVPAKNAGVAAEALSKLLGGRKVNAIGNYVGIALHCSNPNLHPGRLYGLWGPDSQMGLFEEGKVYPENPLFYETWDDKSSDWCQKISEERCKVWAEICKKVPGTGEASQVPMIKPYIESIYAGQIADTSTLSKCFNTNDGFKGFKCPMKEVEGGFQPDFANRYFTEDIPEGFAMYKGIADLAGVETPVIDEIFSFFQKFMGKEYIKDGKLCGADVKETKSPQAFGVKTLEDLLKD